MTQGPTPTCFDNTQNGDEEGVDCGGIHCPVCPSCSDGIQNQAETGVDCGGDCPACAGCTLGGKTECCSDSDCFGLQPYGGVCRPDSKGNNICMCNEAACESQTTVNGEKICEMTCDCPQGEFHF